MNSKGIVALTDTDVCMKCLKKKATHTYTIYGRGYGSSFDMSNTKFQCCDDCDKPEYEEWFNEQEVMDDYVETYQYEEKIWDLIKSLPLESQELFENRFNSDGWYMDFTDGTKKKSVRIEELDKFKNKVNVKCVAIKMESLWDSDEVFVYPDKKRVLKYIPGIDEYKYVPITNVILSKAEIPFLIFERNKGKCFIQKC